MDAVKGDPATLPADPDPQAVAFLQISGGSTGLPKLIPRTHDVSVWEFFLPVLSGATLVMAPPGAHRDPAALARLIRAHGITALHFVP